MGFTPLIPTTVPLLMGTCELAADVQRGWAGQVGVMEPPIDTVKDDPARQDAASDGRTFRRRHGVRDDELLVVSVSRLSVDLKLDALTDVIDAVGSLADRYPVRLVLVGDGDAAAELGRRAAAVNAATGRTVVELPGALLDPRGAYAAADVVAGMGSSALRAMAYAKPVIVQGERGFAAPFDQEHAPQFLWAGFYGLGPGGSAATQVAAALEPLLVDPRRREELGRLGRELVVARYSLRSAAQRLVELYDETRSTMPSRRATWTQAGVVGGRALAAEARLHRPADKSLRAARRTTRLADAAGVAPPSPPSSLTAV
jgi:L-malate glycosyltransferase